MANSVDKTTWSGKESAEIISAALLSGNTIAKGYITLMPGIKHKMALRRFNTGSILQADSCDFTASGTITADIVFLDPVKIKVNEEFCISDYEQYFSGEMVNGAHNSDLTFESFIIDHYGKKVGDGIEKHIWSGDTAGALARFDGLNKLAGTRDVVGAVLTVGNIIAEMGKTYNAIPEAVLQSGNAKLFMSFSAVSLYRQAVAALTSGSPVGAIELNYLGIEVVGVPMPANEMIVTFKENIYFGTDLASDLNEVKMIDLRESTGDDKIRLVMKAQGGVQIGHRADLVLYKYIAP